MFRFFRRSIFYQYSWLIIWIQRILDGAVVLVLLGFLCQFHGVSYQIEYLALGGITFLLIMIIFQGTQLYRPWRGADLKRLVGRVFLAWVIVVAVLLGLGFASKTSYIFSRAVLLPWIVLTPVVLVILRLMLFLSLHWARARGINIRSVIIAGAGDLGKRLAANINDTPWIGIKIEGFFDDYRKKGKTEIQLDGRSYPILGGLDDMVEFVREKRIDMVYLALPLRAEKRLRVVVDALQDTTASVYFVPDIFVFSLLQASLTDLRGIPLISLWETPFYGVNSWLKRVVDIFLGAIILISISPLLLVIALGVKLSSPGPVIFKQRRYGLNGEEIRVYKFRTMKVCEDGEVFTQALRNDPRATGLGKFLRRTSLDELPQFINVLQGTMSIVGPRPHPVAMNEYYRRRVPGYMLRHKVRPGITGWAQINGWRGGTDTLGKMEKRLEYDLEYLRCWSLWLDCKIIFLTIINGFKSPHAY